MKKRLDKIRELELSFRKELHKHTSLIISDEYHHRPDKVGKRFFDNVFGRDTDSSDLTPNTNKENYILNLFYAFIELFYSFNKLQVSTILTQQITKNKLIEKHILLSYYFESFIAEQYIFTERVRNLFNYLEKRAEKLKLIKEYREIIKSRTIFTKGVRNINKIRSEHTHEKRYEDKRFIQLNSIAMLKSIEPNTFDRYSERIYREHKEYYIGVMIKNIDDLELLTDEVLEMINNIIFDTILNKIND